MNYKPTARIHLTNKYILGVIGFFIIAAIILLLKTDSNIQVDTVKHVSKPTNLLVDTIETTSSADVKELSYLEKYDLKLQQYTNKKDFEGDNNLYLDKMIARVDGKNYWIVCPVGTDCGTDVVAFNDEGTKVLVKKFYYDDMNISPDTKHIAYSGNDEKTLESGLYILTLSNWSSKKIIPQNDLGKDKVIACSIGAYAGEYMLCNKWLDNNTYEYGIYKYDKNIPEGSLFDKIETRTHKILQ